MQVPLLETKRLKIRALSLEDLESCHRLYVGIGWADAALSDEANREQRQRWLEWTIRSREQQALLHQPPYGERAVVLAQSGQFVGLVGLVPWLEPFGQLPFFGGKAGARTTAEVGLFWALLPEAQGRGYATEAARALIDAAFNTLNLARILAGTERGNHASRAVMRRLGMRIEENPFPEPPWFQVAGILEAPSAG
ncbi:GNAT family N-acetyltransferase [Stigmatella aurantiaca]|uniref:Acetyltransferase, gnat family n=1 Tax=Stigmatella aurantiaca (strain DW4/3-1) TaxID=378806 RepID=Q08X38_STIAD|nr:GNAT family N-acetyltransferase [Stigmatella aurantiaca]ADO76004.1 Acetyltransferase, gnat family [Stigmatella aurantiaca DW4/3-1]EAU65035.1 acetyltransferase, gnat family [Stigmatella aurantiaca DW4/3-1]